MFSKKLTAFLALAIAPIAIRAQAMAQCGAHGQALKADNGLSPCEIASLLVGKGTMPSPSPFPELSSTNQTRYEIPTVAEADNLRCNPIFYNLVSGCAACQSSSTTWSSWEAWTSHCKTNSGVKYIATVMPYDTPLPNWAFTDPLATAGTFNASAAILISTDRDTSVPDTVFNVKSASTTSSGSNDSTVNKGAIAGGTLGGFAVGFVLGALVLHVLGKKKKTPSDRNSVHSAESQDTVAREKAGFRQA